jgi:hypothetical protein
MTMLQQLIKPTTSNQTSEYEKSGVYKIICNTCQKSYVGQTNWNVKARFQEHISYIKNNNPCSAYALHILITRHEYGSINDTITLIKQVHNPSLWLPYEQMYIQSFHHNNELIPEQHTNEKNPMFQLLHNKHCTTQPLWYLINNPTQLNQFLIDLHTGRSLTQVSTFSMTPLLHFL